MPRASCAAWPTNPVAQACAKNVPMPTSTMPASTAERFASSINGSPAAASASAPRIEDRAPKRNRHKDVQYSSRIASHVARQQQAHRLRHVINQLVARLPEDERDTDAVRELASYGCPTRMHVVRLLAPRLENEDHTKDVDFRASCF